MKRFAVVFAGVLVAGSVVANSFGAAAHAQGNAERWPERPVKIIVPFQAGSSSDVIARIVGAKLSDRLGQQFIIDNRQGGSSIVGTEAVARAEPDGYTLGLANTTTHASAVGLSSKLAFDPVKDFAPVGMIGYSPFVLLAAPQLGVKTLSELISLAKSKPGKITYASAGPATMANLATVLFARMAGVDIAQIPYRGTAQSVTDLMEGRVDLLMGTIAPSIAFVRGSKMIALATTGPKRNAQLPDIPTMAESGLASYEAGLWSALVAPAGTPTAIVEKLNAALVAVVNAPETVVILDKQGVDIDTGKPAELGATIKSEVEKWRDLIVAAGIKE